MIDFDVLLNKLGAFGAYQILVFSLLLYYQVPGGMNSIAPVFISYTPEYRCLMPFDDDYPTNLTSEDKINLTTPLNKDGDPVDACVRYGYNVTGCVVAGDLSCVEKDEGNTISCENYYFNDSLFSETSVTEFELVCGRSYLNTVGSSMYMVGVLLGALIFGLLTDRIGRKLTIVITTIGFLLGMLGVAYSNSVGLFIFFRCLTATFISGCNIAIFSHLMEIVGSKWRTFVGIGYQAGFAIGYMLWTPIAKNYRDWHQMQLGSLVLSSPFALIALLVPESPRWLFVSGKDKRGKKIVHYMERLNKVTIDDETWQEAEEVGREKKNRTKDEKTYSTVDLFRHSGITKVTLAIGFNWFVNSMVYYGVSLSAGSLAGDIFMNNIYAGVFELISYIICILIMDRVGRRLLLSVSLIGAGVNLLSATIVNEYAGNDETLITLGLVFAFLGKAFVSASFAVVYNFTGELYPTVIRGSGIGFASMCARIGSIISPAIIELDQFAQWLPNSIFGAFAVIGGLSSLWFRDTTGVEMMETIEEAELFYNGKEHMKGSTEMKKQTYEKEVDVSDEHPGSFGTAL